MRKNPHLASTRRNGPTCLKISNCPLVARMVCVEGILSLSGGCLDGVWIVSWGSLIGVHKKGQKGVLNMFSKACLKSKR